MGFDRNNLLRRVGTATPGVVLMLAAFYLGGIFFAVIVTGIAVLSFAEYVEMARKMGRDFPAIPFGVTGTVILLSILVFPKWPDLWVLVGAFLFLCVLTTVRYPRTGPEDLAFGVTGVFYIFVLYSFFFQVRELPGGFFWLLTVMVLVWVGDTAAYFAGIRVGRRPLAPRLSPKKTWEGALAGVASCVLLASLIGGLSGVYHPLAGAGLGLAAGAAAVLGDLFESALKRSADVKDTGRFLPGHGGLLDRFDSALFAVPVSYLYILFVILA